MGLSEVSSFIIDGDETESLNQKYCSFPHRHIDAECCYKPAMFDSRDPKSQFLSCMFHSGTYNSLGFNWCKTL